MKQNNDTPEVQENIESVEVQDDKELKFTQEDVNRILNKRLMKLKEELATSEEKISKRVEEATAEATATRTAELDAREQMLNCKSYVLEKGYPAELINLIDTSDAKAFKTKADTLVRVLCGYRRHDHAPIGSPEPIITRKAGDIEQAFSNKKAHEPKPWPPQYD